MADEENAPLVGVDRERQKEATWFVIQCAVVASLGSLLLGYDIGVTSGILPYLQDQFLLDDKQTETFAGIVNLMAAIGALAGGPIADKYGRRVPMIIAAVLFITAGVVTITAQSYAMLILGRCLLGSGIGLKLMISPIYISEICPPKVRGFMVSFAEICINVGLFTAYATAMLLEWLPQEIGWRVLFVGSVLPAMALLYALFKMPESPRWLVTKGRPDEARKTIGRTFATDEEADEAFKAIKDNTESGGSGGDTPALGMTWKSTRELFGKRIFYIGIAVAGLQQINGSEAFVMYIPSILTRIGFCNRSTAITYTTFIGMIKLTGSIIGGMLIDGKGRRPMAVFGYIGMAFFMGCMAVGVRLCTQAHVGLLEDKSTSFSTNAFIFSGMFGFMAFFATTAGPLCWVILGELFPLRFRSTAVAFATASNRIGSYIIAGQFLSLCNQLSPAGAYTLFAWINVAGVIFFYFLLPETKGKSLEGIEAEVKE